MESVKTYRLIDGHRVETGKTYGRDTEWSEEDKDCYIVGVNNWIVNSDGLFLVQRRALTKKNNPGKWSSTNGLVQPAEESIETVIRETKEELGIDINRDQITLVEESHIAGEHLLVDIFVTRADVSLEDLTIQESEIDQICYVPLDELLTLDVSTTCSYIRELGQTIYKLSSK